MSEKIAVVGAGAFGTALAAVIALAGRHAVTLVGRDPALMADLKAEHLHDSVLPGIELPEALEFSAEADAISDAGIVLFAMPSQAQVVAAENAEIAERLAQAISGRTFRLYPSSDRIGVQLGGALKNVLAIACGIVEGAGIGDSARAALIARGLAEMSRFVVAKGGQADTVRGLSGLGDLVLTATSHQSRNLRFGIALGRGETVDPTHGELVEGAFAA